MQRYTDDECPQQTGEQLFHFDMWERMSWPGKVRTESSQCKHRLHLRVRGGAGAHIFGNVMMLCPLFADDTDHAEDPLLCSWICTAVT